MKNPLLRRFLLVFVLTGGLFMIANGQTVSFNVKSVTVQKAISMFQRQTGYSFVFAADELDVNRIVSVRGNKVLLNNVINQILEGQDVSYVVDGKRIIVRSQQQQERKNSAKKTSSNNNIREAGGRIVDERGEPIVGATVSQKGTLSVQHFLDLLPKILLQAFILNDFYVVVESEDEAPYTRIVRHIGL